MPISQSNTLEQLQPPVFADLGLEGTFNWLLENYPYEPAEITKLKGFYEAQKAKTDTPGITHFNVVQRNMGIALQHLAAQHLAAHRVQQQTGGGIGVVGVFLDQRAGGQDRGLVDLVDGHAVVQVAARLGQHRIGLHVGTEAGQRQPAVFRLFVGQFNYADARK